MEPPRSNKKKFPKGGHRRRASKPFRRSLPQPENRVHHAARRVCKQNRELMVHFVRKRKKETLLSRDSSMNICIKVTNKQVLPLLHLLRSLITPHFSSGAFWCSWLQLEFTCTCLRVKYVQRISWTFTFRVPSISPACGRNGVSDAINLILSRADVCVEKWGPKKTTTATTDKFPSSAELARAPVGRWYFY